RRPRRRPSGRAPHRLPARPRPGRRHRATGRGRPAAHDGRQLGHGYQGDDGRPLTGDRWRGDRVTGRPPLPGARGGAAAACPGTPGTVTRPVTGRPGGPDADPGDVGHRRGPGVVAGGVPGAEAAPSRSSTWRTTPSPGIRTVAVSPHTSGSRAAARSEERRVGKEGRTRGWAAPEQRKQE